MMDQARRRIASPCCSAWSELNLESPLRPTAFLRRLLRECLHLWWGPWSSKPVEGLNKALSGFDSHTLPLSIFAPFTELRFTGGGRSADHAYLAARSLTA